VSSERESHDVVGESGEAKMESLTDQRPRCLRIFLMRSRSTLRLSTGSSSMNGMIFIVFEHFGQVKGSTFPDQVRDRLQSFGSILPNFSWIALRIHLVPGCRVSIHPRLGFEVFVDGKMGHHSSR